MATKPKLAVVKSVPVVKTTLPAALREELIKRGREMIKEDIARETTQATFLSIKGKEFTVGGESASIKGGEEAVEVVLLNSIAERAYYPGPFKDGSTSSPICFALAPTPTEMELHAASSDKQSSNCDGCPWNKWETAPIGRKGKACRESRRVALTPRNDLGRILMLRIPITSVPAFQQYLRTIGSQDYPMNRAITRLTFDPAESYPKLLFEFVQPLSESKWPETEQRRAEASTLLRQPFSISAEPVAPIQQKKAARRK